MKHLKIVRWGILGCGDVTEIKSGPALQNARGSQLVAVMRRQENLAADYAARHNVPFSTGNAEELIHHPEVNAVYIATPPGSHLELALQVCAARKPCYVEKPMARSAAEGRQMLQAFQEAGLPLYVAFYRRGLDRFQTARRLLAENTVGTVSGVSYQFSSTLQPDGPLPWRLQAEHAGAGLFYDLGSHLLDILDFLLGPLQQVSGTAANVGSPMDVEDTVAMSFLAQGAPGVAHWNFAASHHADNLTIHGTLGQLSMSCFGSDPVQVQTATGLHEWDGSVPRHVQGGLVQTIVDELRGEGAALSTGQSALRTMEVMDAVLAAYYGGRGDDFWTRPETWPGRIRRQDM